MPGILEWLGQVFSELFPPWVIVARTHRGVRQRNVPLPAFVKRWWDGTFIKDCGPGFIFKIPFIDEVWELPVRLESDDLENIETETRDGLCYDISPVLEWKASNPTKAAFDVSNYESSLKNQVRAIIVLWVNRQTGLLDVERMQAECSEQARKIGSAWGCFAKEVRFNSCARKWQTYELRHTVGHGPAEHREEPHEAEGEE